MSESNIFAYAFVSGGEWREYLQSKQFREMGIEERCIFIDGDNGPGPNRTQYQTMCAMLREGDLVYLSSLNCLGRDYTEMGEEWKRIVGDIGADICVLDVPILDTRAQGDEQKREFLSEVVVALLDCVAHSDLEEMRSGAPASTRNTGKYAARKHVEVDKKKFEEIYSQVRSGSRTSKSAMDELGLKQGAYYRLVKQLKEGTGPWA